MEHNLDTNASIIASGWLKIIGLDTHLTVRDIIGIIFDNAEEDSNRMLRALIDECPEIAEQFRPKTLSKWLFKLENKPIAAIDPTTKRIIQVRFTAHRKYGTEVTWRIALMPQVLLQAAKPLVDRREPSEVMV